MRANTSNENNSDIVIPILFDAYCYKLTLPAEKLELLHIVDNWLSFSLFSSR